MNLQILVTLGSALALYIFVRLAARWDATDLEKSLDRIEKKLDSINTFLTRLEGRFEERGYWEAREWHRTGTDDKNQ